MIDALLREINDSLYYHCENNYKTHTFKLHTGIFSQYGWVGSINDELLRWIND